MKTSWEIILVGYGGQGLGRAGQLMAEAAIKYSDFYVAHNQSYGAQARGGASQSSLIISNDEIIYPLVEEADIMIALSPEGYLKHEPQVNSLTGIIIYDSSISIMPQGRTNERGFPFQSTIDELQHPGGITLMALGTMLEMCNIISFEAMQDVIKEQFSGKFLELNLKALQRGRAMAIDS